MISVNILEDHDIIQESDYCRPLSITTITSYSDFISFTNTYSGQPENNVKWLTAKQTIPFWVGRQVQEFNNRMYDISGQRYEFIRGAIPKSHQYGPTAQELRELYTEYLKNNAFKNGKYRHYTYYEVYHNNPDYFNWATSKSIVKTFEEFKNDCY